jgi:23S rRNA (cytosine1962-C5)-methyltransferase
MTARIVQRLQGAADHPVDLAFPEGEYLKGLLLQVD